jgi:hypothetical protein
MHVGGCHKRFAGSGPLAMEWNRFALIDAGRDAPALAQHIQTQANHAGVACRALLENQPEVALMAHGPWLIEVPFGHAYDDLTRWLHQIANPNDAAAWLACETDFDALFAHFEQLLDVAFPNGELGLLRYWDARVFARLQRIFDPEQLVYLMGPILEWEIRLGGHPLHVSRASMLEWIAHKEQNKEVSHADTDT